VSDATEFARRFGVSDAKMAVWGTDIADELAAIRSKAKTEPERLEMGYATYLELHEAEPHGALVRCSPEDMVLYGIPVHIEDIMPYRLARIRTPKSRPENNVPAVVKEMAVALGEWRKAKRHQPEAIEMSEATADNLALRTQKAVAGFTVGSNYSLFGIPIVYNDDLPYGIARPVNLETTAAASKGDGGND
jgi:hypothetical protein